MELAVQKKKEKRGRLLDAAYELFTTKGINNTVIDDIVRRAGVAKGTFYLYFKDKYDLVDKIILHKSGDVIVEALEALTARKEKWTMTFEQDVLFFTNYLLEFFVAHRDMLTLIHKNLSVGLAAAEAREDPPIRTAIDCFKARFMEKGVSEEEAVQTLYIIIVMVGGVACDAILAGQPYPLETIRPRLFACVKKILQ